MDKKNGQENDSASDVNGLKSEVEAIKLSSPKGEEEMRADEPEEEEGAEGGDAQVISKGPTAGRPKKTASSDQKLRKPTGGGGIGGGSAGAMPNAQVAVTNWMQQPQPQVQQMPANPGSYMISPVTPPGSDGGQPFSSGPLPPTAFNGSTGEPPFLDDFLGMFDPESIGFGGGGGGGGGGGYDAVCGPVGGNSALPGSAEVVISVPSSSTMPSQLTSSPFSPPPQSTLLPTSQTPQTPQQQPQHSTLPPMSQTPQTPQQQQPQQLQQPQPAVQSSTSTMATSATAAVGGRQQRPVSDATRQRLIQKLHPPGPKSPLVDESFNTPVHNAVLQQQSAATIDYQLSSLNDEKKLLPIINMVNANGHTPLSLSLKMRRADLIPLLLNFDAAPTQLCCSAVERTNHFHYAMAKCLDNAASLQLVENLLTSVSRHCRMDLLGLMAKDRRGKTPLDYLNHRISRLEAPGQQHDPATADLLTRLRDLRVNINGLLAG